MLRSLDEELTDAFRWGWLAWYSHSNEPQYCEYAGFKLINDPERLRNFSMGYVADVIDAAIVFTTQEPNTDFAFKRIPKRIKPCL